MATGYTKGRPRIGEIRPLTMGGLHSAAQRAKQIKKDAGAFRMQQAIYQGLWRHANLERSNEISRNSGRRARRRNDPDAIFVVA